MLKVFRKAQTEKKAEPGRYESFICFAHQLQPFAVNFSAFETRKKNKGSRRLTHNFNNHKYYAENAGDY
jgi:hypothetical protein